jgi:hypothetical protein
VKLHSLALGPEEAVFILMRPTLKFTFGPEEAAFILKGNMLGVMDNSHTASTSVCVDVTFTDVFCKSCGST